MIFAFVGSRVRLASFLEINMRSKQSLKALRGSRNITIREVELQSRKIAEAKGDRRYYISNARLTQLENDPLSEPSLWKLFSLSAIYHVKFTELMRIYNVDADESDKYNAIAIPECTRLLSNVPDDYRTTAFLRTLVKLPEKTTLLSGTAHKQNDKRGTRLLSCGYIGLDDFTMHPLIRPGSFVWIDTRQNKLRLITWRTEHERPLYFVELREGYFCGWCELQGSQLLIIPHHSSRVSVRHFLYPRDAEIVGRVVKFSTPCIDQDPSV